MLKLFSHPLASSLRNAAGSAPEYLRRYSESSHDAILDLFFISVFFYFNMQALNSLTNCFKDYFCANTQASRPTVWCICLLLKLHGKHVSRVINSMEFTLWMSVSLIFLVTRGTVLLWYVSATKCERNAFLYTLSYIWANRNKTPYSIICLRTKGCWWFGKT